MIRPREAVVCTSLAVYACRSISITMKMMWYDCIDDTAMNELKPRRVPSNRRIWTILLYKLHCSHWSQPWHHSSPPIRMFSSSTAFFMLECHSVTNFLHFLDFKKHLNTVFPSEFLLISHTGDNSSKSFIYHSYILSRSILGITTLISVNLRILVHIIIYISIQRFTENNLELCNFYRRLYRVFHATPISICKS